MVRRDDYIDHRRAVSTIVQRKDKEGKKGLCKELLVQPVHVLPGNAYCDWSFTQVETDDTF